MKKTMMLSGMLSVMLLGLVATSLIAEGDSHANTYEVGIGMGAHFVPSEKVDALSESQAFPVLHLEVAMALPALDVVSWAQTEVAVQYDNGQLRGTTFERIESKLDVQTLSIHGRLRRQLSPSWSALAQVGLGWQSASLSLEDASGGRPISGDANGLSLASALSIDLRLMQKESDTGFTLAFRTSLGYEASTSLHLDSERHGEELAIPTLGRELGSVNMSGAMLSWALIGGF